MKQNYMKGLNEIQGMIGSIRSINEAVSFKDDEMDTQAMNPDEAPIDEPQASQPEGDEMAAASRNLSKMPMDKGDEEDEALSSMDEVDTIRELCLKGMVKRCHNVEDPGYEALKKILQMCDKAMEPKDDNNAR